MNSCIYISEPVVTVGFEERDLTDAEPTRQDFYKMGVKMDFESSYFNDRERIELVEDYILHETNKICTGRHVHAEQKIRTRIGDEHTKLFLQFQKDVLNDRPSIKKTLNSYSTAQKWMLLHAISFGLFYKKLFCCVGWDRLDWSKQILPCSALRFETNLNYIHEMKIKKPFFTDVVDFAQRKYAQSGNDWFLQNQNIEFAKMGARERINDPIICRKKPRYFLIHDGTGRMLTLCGEIVMKKIDRNTTITAWVGGKKRFSRHDRHAYRMAKKELFPVIIDSKSFDPEQASN